MAVKFEAYGFVEANKELRKLGKAAGKVGADFTDSAAKVAASTMMRNVQPFGVGAKARKAGEGAIKRDMSRAFIVVSDSAAGKAGVITSMSGALRHLDSVAKSTRHVNYGVSAARITRSVWMAVLDAKIARVGVAKGSFSGGVVKLGGRAQKWITRHGGAGRSVRRKLRGGAEWSFRSNVEHIRSKRVLGEVGMTRVLNKIEPNLRRHFKALIKAKARKSERKINR